MNCVHFRIKRKWAFAGAALKYKICINGEYVGTVRNGKTIDVCVQRADKYYVDEYYVFTERNAIIHSSLLDDSEPVELEIQRRGGWKTDSYNEFLLIHNRDRNVLTSFEYDWYFEACNDDSIFNTLSESEKVLVRSIEFIEAVSDAADEVLSSSHLPEMLESLTVIGAGCYAKAFKKL